MAHPLQLSPSPTFNQPHASQKMAGAPCLALEGLWSRPEVGKIDDIKSIDYIVGVLDHGRPSISGPIRSIKMYSLA